MNARQGGFYQILGEIRTKKYFMIAAMVVSAAVMSACGNKTANNQRETPVKNIVIENTGNTVDKKNPEDISNRAGGAKETGNPEDISNRAGGAKNVLGQVKVTADSLNVRSWASTSSQILAVAGAGQVFDYTEELDEWYCVQGTVDGVPVTGYIWKAYSSPML